MTRRILIAAVVTWATLALVAAFAWLRHPAPTAAPTTPAVVVLNGTGTTTGTSSGQISATSQTATAHATTRTS